MCSPIAVARRCFGIASLSGQLKCDHLAGTLYESIDEGEGVETLVVWRI